MKTSFLLIALSLALLTFKPLTNKTSGGKIFAPPKSLDLTHFGFNLVLSDILWLDFIQHNFECSPYGEDGACTKRWGFTVLEEATQLDPKFLYPYLHGGVQLSVINGDHKGAASLFERGIESIDDKWQLFYRAAYINMIELDDKEKAADYLVTAADLGAPQWTRSLASKLYTKVGKAELSYRTLYDLYSKTEEGPWRDDLKKRLDELSLELNL